MITWMCSACKEQVDDIYAHLRRFHVDVDTDVESWPDGEPVIHEDWDELL